VDAEVVKPSPIAPRSFWHHHTIMEGAGLINDRVVLLLINCPISLFRKRRREGVRVAKAASI
jgi:hypothetical protein